MPGRTSRVFLSSQPGLHLPGNRPIRGRGARALDLFGYAFCVLLLLYTAASWGPRTFDPLLQNDDVRYLVYAFDAAWADSFSQDYLHPAMSIFAPWFYRIPVNAMIAAGADLLWLTKWIQLAAIAWACLSGFRIGHRRAGGFGGLLGLYLVLHCYPLLDRAAGGLPRAFGMPAILFAMDAMDARRPWRAALAVILAFALYPSAGVIAAPAYAAWSLLLLLRHPRSRRWRKAIALPLVSAAVLSFLVLSPSLASNPAYGRLHTVGDAPPIPEFRAGGRIPIPPFIAPVEDLVTVNLMLSRASSDRFPWPEDWPLLLSSRRVTVTPFNLLLLATLIAGLVAGFFGGLRISAIPFLVLLSGTVAYFLARAIPFHLYLPARFLLNALPPAAIVFLITTLAGLGRSRKRPALAPLVTAAGMLVCVATVGLALPGPVGLSINARGERELFEKLETLPEDALFAGHPKRVDNIPLWARRRILIGYETSQPWYDGMWAELKIRNFAALEALYATDPAPLIALRDSYGVDYLLVHDDDIGPGFRRKAGYFEPFRTWLMPRLASIDRDDLLVSRASPDSIVFQASGFRVIDLDQFLSGLPAPPSIPLYRPEPLQGA